MRSPFCVEPNDVSKKVRTTKIKAMSKKKMLPFYKNQVVYKIKASDEIYYKNGDTTDPSQQRCKISLTPVSEWQRVLCCLRQSLRKVFRH